MQSILQDFGTGARMMRRQPRLHRRRASLDPRARHRRQHRDLQLVNAVLLGRCPTAIRDRLVVRARRGRERHRRLGISAADFDE